MFGNYRMDRLAQGAGPFAMNNPHLEYAPFNAGGEIIRHEIMDFARLEIVQVEHTINRKLHWLVLVHVRRIRRKHDSKQKN
jgi:hypothetical protein